MLDGQNPNSGPDRSHKSEREIDLEIVSNSWLSLTESAGFDALVSTWSDKFALSKKQGKQPSSLVDAAVTRQLAPIVDVLEADAHYLRIDPLEREIYRSRSPAMALSPDGTVAALGNDAENHFGVRLGHLANTHWLDESSLADWAALQRTVIANGNLGYAILKVRRRDGTQCVAEAYKLQPAQYRGAFTIVRSLDLGWSDDITQKLIQAYDLTDTEAEICRLLFQLRDLEAVAQKRGVTQGTARTQLKRIFLKMDLHSKADLVKVLAMLCAASTSAEPELPESLVWSDPLGNEQWLKRDDGRKLAYSWIGAEFGQEIIFVHGELPLFYLPPSTREMLAKAGVKLWCISMPGHGSSDPAPRDVSQFDDGLDALEGFLRFLGKPTPIFASFSGMNFAMALARKPANLVSAIAVLGIPWNLTPRSYNALPANQRTLAQLAVKSPRMFDLVCKLGWRMMQREGPDFYLKRAFAGSPSDEVLIQDGRTQPFLRAACRHLVAQGHRAFIREIIKTANFNPADLLATLAVPAHWIVPGDQPTGTDANKAALKAMSPHITIETVPGCGELMPYQRPEVFVRCMADLVSENPAKRFRESENWAG